MNPYDLHAQSCNAVQAEQGAACPTFIWNKQRWQALTSGARTSKSNSPGGFSFDSDLTIVAGVDQFGKEAEAIRKDMLNTQLFYLGHGYTIRDIKIFPGGKQMRLGCVDKAQKV